MMLIPEAWSKKSKIIPKAHREMYNYLNSLIEPWDGPAAIAACDGKWVVAHPEKHASFSDPIAAQMLMNSLPDAVVEVEDADIWWPAPD